MPAHTDAIGYLNDLARENNEPWFKMVCDLVTLNGMSALDQPALDALIAICTQRASYIGIKRSATATAIAAHSVAADFLETLSGFHNFKLLGNTLEVEFKKRITLIFGASGSGKSSLCESIKVLATTDPPIRPIENARTVGALFDRPVLSA